MGIKQNLQEKVFNIVDGGRDLTVDEVREAITEESNMALCKMINDKEITWCLTEVDVFFPDDDYVTVTAEVAKQIITQDDIFHQILEDIDIYRTSIHCKR